jgi:hypothetical protein
MHTLRGIQRESAIDTATPQARSGATPDRCGGLGTLLSGTDPKTMTAQQRSHEVAVILAVGILRRHSYGALAASSGPGLVPGQPPESGQERLAVSRGTVLSGPTG